MTSRTDPLIASSTGFTLPVKVVFGFTLLHLTVAGVWARSQKNDESLLYLAVVIAALWIFSLIHRRIRFSVGLLWCLSILILLHLAGGLIEVPRAMSTEGKKLLYNLWLIKSGIKYDHAVHTFGSGTATWLCWQLLQRTVASRTGWAYRDLKPKPELLLFCVLSGLGLGAINEVLEFYTTRFIPHTNVGGYVNNALDLAADTVGSLIAAMLIWGYARLTHLR